MEAVHAEHPHTADDLLRMARQFNAAEFDRLVAGVLDLRARRAGRVLHPEEGRLLSIINEGLSPEEWTAYRALRGKMRADSLSDEEHTELLRLSDQIEVLQARRIEAVVALARLRNCAPEAVMDDLGLRPRKDE